jgi:hypothetical protein
MQDTFHNVQVAGQICGPIRAFRVRPEFHFGQAYWQFRPLVGVFLAVKVAGFMDADLLILASLMIETIRLTKQGSLLAGPLDSRQGSTCG